MDGAEFLRDVVRSAEAIGPLTRSEDVIREFAEVVARITGDEELVERLAEAVEERDAQAFNALVDELKIRPFCHLLCHWVCVVRCRLTCGLVCPPPPPIRLHLEDELVG